MSARPPVVGTVLRLSKAHQLIRQGQHKAARAMVSPDGRPPEDDAELHTLAAIATREGDFGQALSLWRLLLQRQPRHAEATRMIAAIEIWQERPDWHRYVPLGGGILAVLVIVVVALASFSSSTTSAKVVAQPVVVAAPVAAAPVVAAKRTVTPGPEPAAQSTSIQFSTKPAAKKKAPGAK